MLYQFVLNLDVSVIISTKQSVQKLVFSVNYFKVCYFCKIFSLKKREMATNLREKKVIDSQKLLPPLQ